MATQSTSLGFSFAKDAGSGSFSLENWNGDVGFGAVAMALYDTMDGPKQTKRLYASVGTIIDFQMTGERTVPPQFIEVNGASTASVPDNADFEVLFALDQNGTHITTPNTIRRGGGEVQFSRIFWGLIRIASHTVSFSVLKYTPQKQGEYGSIWTFGVVAAYRNGRLAVCHVSPLESGPGVDEIEVYRVESQSLINKEGEWELPDGWPNNPSYPNGAKPPKPRIGVLTTRVHEVGLVTPQGYFYSRTYDVQNQKPYFGDNTYTPKTTIVQGSGFSRLSDQMKVKAQEAMVRRGKEKYLWLVK